MKKLIAFLLAALMMISFAACRQDKKPDDKKPEQTTSQTEDTKGEDPKKPIDMTPKEIEAKIKGALGDGYLCEVDKDAALFAGYYGLDLSQIEEFVAKETRIASVNPDTVIIIKVKDGYAEKALEGLQTGFARQVDYIRQYPFNTEKVMNGRIYQSGNYVALIIAGASVGENMTAEEEAKLAEREYAKIDAVWKEIFGEAKNIAVIPEDNGNGGGFFDGGNGSLIGG